MRENILNLPQYLRRLPKVYSEQVALAMTGEYTFNFLSDVDKYRDPERWRAVHAFHACILHAVNSGKIVAVRSFLDVSGHLYSAIFEPDDIWPWALAELSDDSPWYGANNGVLLLTSPVVEALPLPNSNSNENLQLLVAGLARLLVARSHKAYLYGKKMNISALARDIAAEIAYALPPDADKAETFRKLLTEALSLLPSDVMSLNK